MSEQTNNTTPSTEPKKSNRTLIYVVAILAVLLVGALVLNFIRENNLKDTNAKLMVAYSQLDSIGKEMDSKIMQIVMYPSKTFINRYF